MTGTHDGRRIDVDVGRCQGIGVCESIAPRHFEVGDDGIMRIIRPEVAPAELDLIRDAVDACPTQSLRLSGE